MTVAELIQELQQMPQDMEVKFAYNFGDYWGTEVCGYIDGVEIQSVVYSDYHRMDKVLPEDREIDEDTETTEMVILS